MSTRMAKARLKATTLESIDLWPAIWGLSRDRGPRLVAVPCVGANADSQLPLRRGDTLVTRFDDATIRAGGVSPKAIGRYLRAGIRVFRADGLHAKVYVSAARAIVCFANLSESSEGRLLEAGFVTRQPSLVAQARRFVTELSARSSFVGPELAKAKEAIYRPPAIPLPRRVSDKTSLGTLGTRFWLLKVDYVDHDSVATAAADRVHATIPVRADASRYRLDDVEVPDTWSAVRIRARDELLQIYASGRPVWLEPIALVAGVTPFKSARGGQKRMLVVEARKGLRDRRLSALKSTLSLAEVRRLARVGGPTECRDPDLIERLRKVWKR